MKQEGMTFDHDFCYFILLFSSLLKKEGKEKENDVAKIVIKSHTFLFHLIYVNVLLIMVILNCVCFPTDAKVSGITLGILSDNPTRHLYILVLCTYILISGTIFTPIFCSRKYIYKCIKRTLLGAIWDKFASYLV